MNKMNQKTPEIKEMNSLEERNFHSVQIIEIHKYPSIIRVIQRPVLLKILKNDLPLNILLLREVII